MQDDVVHYAGQPVAVVVADSLERAAHAATLVRVTYAEAPSVTTIDQGRADAYEPEKIFGGFIPGRLERDGLMTGSRRLICGSTRRSGSLPTTTTRSKR